MHLSYARARFARVCSSVTFSLLIAAPLVAHAQDIPDTTAKIHYKGLTLTPIGYFAAEAVFRGRNETADIGSNFNNIPFTHTSNANLTEFRGSARQSRIGLAADGKAGDVKLSGFWESDFLTVGTTSNSNESNSYALRIRQFWGRALFSEGSGFEAGQMWSLMAPAKKGVSPRGEAVPVIIDAQYNVGFDWARQWGMRFEQNFDKASFAIGVEEPQMTFGGHGVPTSVFIGDVGGSQLNATANYSTDVAPDAVFKLAVDPGFGHWEIKALGRVFRDRIVDTSAAGTLGGSRNVTAYAGGVGAGMWLPFMSGKRDVFDFGLSGMWGIGIGRYGSSQLIDATVKPDGSITPVRAAHALLSLEAHPTTKLDIFAYAGTEYEGRTAGTTAAGKPVGYGSPLSSNATCDKEILPASPYVPGASPACTGDTRDLYEGTLGFWYSFYRGPVGRVAWGLEYHYVSKNTWVGVGGQPQAIDNMLFTSFRFYLP